jgi:hypothetical protein
LTRHLQKEPRLRFRILIGTVLAALISLAAPSRLWSHCGLMIVSGQTTGFTYTGNPQSPVLAANDVSYTWASSQSAPNQFAIFQTHDPWAGTIIKTAITNAGYSYSVFSPASMAGFNYANYSVVILNFDDTCPSAFDPPYSSEIPSLQNYVLAGGVLWLQGAIQGLTSCSSDSYSLPFGGTANFDIENDNYIINPASPLMAGVSNPFSGNYASHVNFSGYPPSSSVIAVTGTAAGGWTTLYQYGFSCNSPTFSPTLTPFITPTFSLSPTTSQTFTISPTFSFSPTPSPTFSVSPTFSDSPTPSPTFSVSPTFSQTPTPSVTPSWSPSFTRTVSPTFSLTYTATPPPLLLHPYDPNPNPAGPGGVYIPYWLQTNATVDITVYAVSGELVRRLDPFQAPAGSSEQFWDEKNISGAPVASGIFILHLVATSPRGEQIGTWEKCAVLK